MLASAFFSIYVRTYMGANKSECTMIIELIKTAPLGNAVQPELGIATFL